VELDGWAYGPVAAADRVSGSLEDFCLLVTNRRHREDLALFASGPVAEQWLGIAQVFPDDVSAFCAAAATRPTNRRPLFNVTKGPR
jgi:hypothetical protein